ncbi:MAG: hypothetical protein ACRDOO_02395 [Actinomadura sp.]
MFHGFREVILPLIGRTTITVIAVSAALAATAPLVADTIRGTHFTPGICDPGLRTCRHQFPGQDRAPGDFGLRILDQVTAQPRNDLFGRGRGIEMRLQERRRRPPTDAPGRNHDGHQRHGQKPARRMIHTGLDARGAPSVKEISNGSTEITLFRADRLGQVGRSRTGGASRQPSRVPVPDRRFRAAVDRGSGFALDSEEDEREHMVELRRGRSETAPGEAGTAGRAAAGERVLAGSGRKSQPQI